MFPVELRVTVAAPRVSKIVLLSKAVFLFRFYFSLSLPILAQVGIRLGVIWLIRVQHNVFTILIDLVVPLVLLYEILTIPGWTARDFESLAFG